VTSRFPFRRGPFSRPPFSRAPFWRQRAGLLTLLLLIPQLTGCDLPVHVGIKEARAAGVDLPARAQPPASPLLAQGQAQPQGPSPGPAAAPARAQAPAASGRLLYLPALPKPSGPDDVVGLKLEWDGREEPRLITFGQVFIPGAVPRGQTVVARIDGRDVPTQMDVKTTNPDGSVRFGVITLVANRSADVMLARRPGGPPPGAPVDLASLDGRYDLTAEIVFHQSSGDETRRIDIAPLLARALRAGKLSYWLRGPLVTEARIEAPVIGSMRLTADIRAYADGSTASDVQFNNDIAMGPVGGKLDYDVRIVQGGKPVLTKSGLKHFQYQTWHHVVWSVGEPAVNVVHDTAYYARAAAIHNYDLSTGVQAAVIDGQTALMNRDPGFDILGNYGITKGMGMTGGRPDIGAVTLPNTLWIMTQNRDAARYALAQADGAGSVPWHFYDLDAGTHITVTKYPGLWADGRGGKAGKSVGLTQPIDNPGSGWGPDTSHQPDLSYVPYIMTGSRYRLDQLNAQASGTIAMIWYEPRLFDKAILADNFHQVRGRAWAFRAVTEAAFINDDASPIRAYFQMSQRNTIEFMLNEARQRTKGETYGWFGDHNQPPLGGEIAPWMLDFLALSMALAAEQGVPGAKDVLIWQSNFLVQRFLAADRGFRPNNATSYRLIMFTPGTPEVPLLTWREVEAASIARGYARDSGEWYHDGAYVQAARAALGAIVTVTGGNDARRAFTWLTENGYQSGLGNFQRNPTWNIVPMSDAGTRP